MPARRLTSRSLLTFLVLGFALSWYPWVLHLLGRPGNGGPNPLGLLLAALIAGYFDGGWRGSTEILRSIARIRARVWVWAAVLRAPSSPRMVRNSFTWLARKAPVPSIRENSGWPTWSQAGRRKSFPAS
jgi:hypothetical protein